MKYLRTGLDTGVPVERDSESSGRKQPGSLKWKGWIGGAFSTTALLGWLGKGIADQIGVKIAVDGGRALDIPLQIELAQRHGGTRENDQRAEYR